MLNLCQCLSGSEWLRAVPNGSDGSHTGAEKMGKIIFLVLLATLCLVQEAICLCCDVPLLAHGQFHITRTPRTLSAFHLACPHLELFQRERAQEVLLVSVPLRGTGFTHSSRHNDFSTQSASLCL